MSFPFPGVTPILNTIGGWRSSWYLQSIAKVCLLLPVLEILAYFSLLCCLHGLEHCIKPLFTSTFPLPISCTFWEVALCSHSLGTKKFRQHKTSLCKLIYKTWRSVKNCMPVSEHQNTQRNGNSNDWPPATDCFFTVSLWKDVVHLCEKLGKLS